MRSNRRFRVVGVAVALALALAFPAASFATGSTTPATSGNAATTTTTTPATTTEKPATTPAATTPATATENPATAPATTPATTPATATENPATAPATTTPATAATTTTTAAAPTALVAQSTPSLEGTYVVGIAISGEVLDVSAGLVSTSGTNVQVWNANRTAAQRWQLVAQGAHYQVLSATSGYALVAESASAGANVSIAAANAGDPLQLWDVVLSGSTYQLQNVAAGCLLVTTETAACGANVSLAADGTSAASSAWTLSAPARPLADGYYTLSSALNGSMSVDVSGASLADAATVQIWDSNGTLAQKWHLTYDARTGYYVLNSVNALKALDVCCGGSTPGTRVWQYQDNGTLAQSWAIESNGGDGTFTLYSARSGLALDVPGATASNGNPLWIYTPNGTGAQRWNIAATDLMPTGLVQIASAVDASRVVEVQSASLSGDAGMQLWGTTGTTDQKWVASRVSSGAYAGTYRFMNANSGLYLAADGTTAKQVASSEQDASQLWNVVPGGYDGLCLQNASTGRVLDLRWAEDRDGALVQTWQSNGTRAQSWRVSTVPVLSSGTYLIYERSNRSVVLDVSGASGADGANVQLWSDNGTYAQKWVVSASGNSCTIANAGSSKVLDVMYGEVKPNSNVWQYSSNGTAAQQWNLSVGATGGMVLTSAAGDGILGVTDDAAPVSGSNVVTRPSSSASTQTWGAVPTVVNSERSIRQRIDSTQGGDAGSILSIGNTSRVSQGSIDQVAAAIQAFHDRGANVGFVMVDLQNGNGVSYNADQGFYSASSIKGPWMAFFLESVADAGNSAGDYGDRAWSTIVYSDNEAYLSLRDEYWWSNDAFGDWLERAGVSRSLEQPQYVTYSARDLAKMWNHIDRYLGSAGNGLWLSERMAETNHSPIRDALGWKATVRNKAGWYTAEYDFVAYADVDAAVVEADGHSYLLVINSDAGADSGLLAPLASALDQVHMEVM